MYGNSFDEKLHDSRQHMSAAEKLAISRDLEQFHKIFDTFWQIADVYLVDNANVKTACVTLPKGKKATMYISISFWNSLNDDEKLFVIIHECMHVLLDHGMRNAKNVPGATHRLINIAQDITINEMIVYMFGFNRGLMADWRKYCWIETCFDDPTKILQNQVFEYYLLELIKNPPADMDSFDDHGDDGGVGYDDGDPDPLAKDIAEELTMDELLKLLKAMSKQEGRGIGLSPFKVIIEERTPEPLDFKKITEKLKRNAKSKLLDEQDSWSTEQRRFSDLGRGLQLPGVDEVAPKGKKLIAAVYFDVSGSCASYFEKFNKMLQAFRDEEELFELRAFMFDTRVTEVTPNQPIGMGGGTSFDIIEEQNRKIMLETGKYPDFVGVVTDGAGNEVLPRHPARWVWLLTPNATQQFISPRSAWYPIKSVTF